MMDHDLCCPSCRSDEHLRGQRHGELIRISCSACELTWDRDPSAPPPCPRCKGEDVRPVPQAVVEKSRGTQLSIVAVRTVYLCAACDAEVLRRQLQTNSPLAPDENPAGGNT
jgi:NAD-dependent SIR2 family protein deacetylase